MLSNAASRPSGPSLRRVLGRWDLTAIGVNQVIGGAIFLMPSQVAAQVGAWSPLFFVAMGLASMSVALCFAEAGSRFESTGGPYIYTRAAFGRFVGFEVGWMQWFTRASSHATILAGIPIALGYYWPALTAGWPRLVVVLGLTGVLTWVNVRGIRQSSWVINALTLGKVIPLGLFVIVGLAFLDPKALSPLPSVSFRQMSTAALLMIFVYGGYDVVPIPAGEAVDPRRHVPFALIATIFCVMGLMTLAQIVTQSVLPDLPAHSTPVADAAARMLGAGGALVIGVGSVLSMTGNNAGALLTGSRMLFALAEGGDLPAVLGRIHGRFRTPANAVLFSAAVVIMLALTGSFANLAVVSSLARLVTYTGACAATLRFRSMDSRPSAGREPVRRASFVIPLGPAIPTFALLVSFAVVAGATRQQLIGGVAALTAGAVLFAIARRSAGTPAFATSSPAAR